MILFKFLIHGTKSWFSLTTYPRTTMMHITLLVWVPARAVTFCIVLSWLEFAQIWNCESFTIEQVENTKIFLRIGPYAYSTYVKMFPLHAFYLFCSSYIVNEITGNIVQHRWAHTLEMLVIESSNLMLLGHQYWLSSHSILYIWSTFLISWGYFFILLGRT